MSVPRLHVPEPLAAGREIRLDGDRARYLRTVLRLRDGDPVLPFNAADGEWRARLVPAGKRDAALAVEARRRAPAPEPGPVLVFAPIRRSRLDWLVEKAVELGAARLVPVITRRTVVRPESPDRLRAIAVEAAEQCGRLSVPPVEAPRPVAAWLGTRDPRERVLFADEDRSGPPLAAALRAAPSAAALLVGPEGGFDPEEAAALRGAAGIAPVSLGPRVLRAETAALYALVGWQLARDASLGR